MKKDHILRILSYGYFFFIVHCIMTIVLGQDSLGFAFAVLRVDISPLLLYFVVRKLSSVELIKCLKYISLIILVHVFLFLLQYVGINLFNSDNYLGEMDTLRNGSPQSLPLMILISLFVFKNKFKTIAFVLPVMLAASRGVVVSLFFAIGIYFRRYILKVKYLTVISICACVFGFVYISYLHEDYQRYDVSFAGEILKGFDLKTIKDFNAYNTGGVHYSFKENGTFAFRISMVLERILYLFTHPQFLPFGVGMIDDASPNCNFNFFIGTECDMYKYGIGQIYSSDIVWPSIVLRYGIFGIFFWLVLIKNIFKLFNFKKKSMYFRVGYIYMLFFIFNSFGSYWVVSSSWLLPFFIIISYCYQYKIKSQDKQ